MEAKQCRHISSDVGIDREFLKTKKNQKECLGKLFFFSKAKFVNDVKQEQFLVYILIKRREKMSPQAK